jgi:cytochrome c
MTAPHLTHRGRIAAAAGLTLLLAACGKPAPGGANAPSADNTTTPAAPIPAAAPALTDAQKKALIAELPAPYQNADLSNGEAKFAVCRSCHTISQGGEDMTGPNLWGVFGRKAGSKEGFTYSDDMKNAGWTWDADRINTWIQNPRTVLPGTKMTFIGMADANDRRDVIAFLKVQTSAPKS